MTTEAAGGRPANTGGLSLGRDVEEAELANTAGLSLERHVWEKLNQQILEN